MSLKIIQTGTTRKLGCGFLFPFHSGIKRDIGQKSWFLHRPSHSVPPLAESPSEYCHPVWCGKTRMVGLPDGKKTLMICMTVYTQYRRVTDGRTDKQTDRQTDRHLAYHAYASRSKNGTSYSYIYNGGPIESRMCKVIMFTWCHISECFSARHS